MHYCFPATQQLLNSKILLKLLLIKKHTTSLGVCSIFISVVFWKLRKFYLVFTNAVQPLEYPHNEIKPNLY